jgi:hypothetical protein
VPSRFTRVGISFAMKNRDAIAKINGTKHRSGNAAMKEVAESGISI